MNKIFVIAPHMDDEVLGIGGTIRRHVENGDEVHVCIVAYRVYDRKFDRDDNNVERECVLKAKEILGYKEVYFLDLPDERLDICIQDLLIPLEKCYNIINPDILYICHYGDNHQDHRAVFQAARIIFRSSSVNAPGRVLMYETPSSTEQSPKLSSEAFLPNFYVNIESTIDKKREAVKAYERESRSFPHPRSIKALDSFAVCRGVESGFSYAEAFVILREKW